MTPDETTQRWAAHPVQAGLIRVLVFLLPVAGSVLFVHVASGWVAMPTSSFVLFISWWGLMSGGATVVLVAIERATRRLLPLVALYKLSLVFPDAAPSRFRTALRANTVEALEQRVAGAKALPDRSTPVEAAERLLALVAQLDAHDPLTRGHSDRVRAYAQMIGKQLRLDARARDLLNWAALLHDVGKLNVPTEILTKPGRPTDEEWSLLRRHPELGAELIAPLHEWLGEWSQAVPQHHERWDGKGYPNGTSGEEIGLAARIVAVADVFDVITSARSYKSPVGSAAARAEIARCASAQFDPRVVRAFLNISLGRLRLVMGPLSWLAHAPVLARLPLTPALGTVTASVAAVAAAVATGLAAPPTPGLASTVPTPTQTRGFAHPIERVTREDENILVAVEQAEGGAQVTSLRIVAQPSVGRVRVTADGKLLYVPPPDFSGNVSIGYAACWSARGCRQGVLTIRVVPVNDPPIARTDLASTRSGTPVLIDVLANDSDVEGDPLSIFSVSGLSAGRARIIGKRVRWSPPPGLIGTASFRYTTTDRRGGHASARVTVEATRGGASPLSTRSTPEPAPPRGAPAPPRGAPAPPRGAPAPSLPVLVPAVVEPAPPSSVSPLPKPRPVHAPQARPDQLSVPEGGTVVVDVLANDSDTDGDPISLVSVGSPARGETRKVGDRVQFTAPSDYVGPVTVPYTIADSQGAKDSSSVMVSVLLVNAPPSFTAGPGQSVLEDAGPQAVPGWAASIDPGAVSEAGQAVSFSAANDNNALFALQPRIDPAGTLRYTPAPNAHGSATVTVGAKDDGGTANGGSDTGGLLTFAITVTPVNDPPVVNADDMTVAEDTPAGVTFYVLANDIDVDAGDTLSVISYDSSTIAGGTLTDSSGTFTYIPDPGFAGTETFTYTVADSSGAHASATATITVTPVLHVPVAGSDAYTTPLNTPLVVTAPGVLANDGDQDGDAITIQTTPISGAANGTVVIAADGSFSYTPNALFTGTDSFRYRIDDGTGRSADGIVTINVPALPTLHSTLYFRPTGSSSDVWDMTPALPPAAAQLADFDGDGKPGLTIKNSDGLDTNTAGTKYQTWSYRVAPVPPAPPVPLLLDGPVTLDLWNSTGNFSSLKPGTLYAYVYDCTPGGAGDPAWPGCTRIASNTVFASPWGTSLTDWGNRLVTIGSVTRAIPAGNELRVKLLFHPSDLWLTMTAAYPTALVVTLA